MSYEPATYFNSMPPAWCAKRRRDIQAHVNLEADATVAEQRTMLIELLSQLSSTEAQATQLLAYCRVERELNAPLQARIQEWEAAFTEQYQKLAAAEARATKAEAKAAGLLVELGEQEKEKLALVLENEQFRKLLQAGKEYMELTRRTQNTPFHDPALVATITPFNL